MPSTQRVALTCTLTYVNSGTIEPIANQQVTVIHQNGAAATVYNALSGGSAVSEVVTDASGNLNGSATSYFIPEGSYIIQVPASSSYAAFNVYFEGVHGDGVGNLAPSVADLTGDAAGSTLPNVEIVTIGGNQPVTEATTLGGVLAGTLPNPAFSSTALQSLIPAGTIIESASAIAPAGFLPALGGNYSRSTYATLMAAITTTKTVSFGSGVTSVTINDTTLSSFLAGYLGIASVATNTNYSVSIPVSGTGIGSSGINTITAIEITSSTTILTLAAGTSSIETNVSIVLAPHGVGDGQTTFTVPNRSGRVGIGPGTSNAYGAQAWQLGQAPAGANVRGGEEVHGLSAAENGYHAHNFNVNSGGQSANHYHNVVNEPGLTGWTVPFSTVGWNNDGAAAGSAHNPPESSNWGYIDIANIQAWNVNTGWNSNDHTHNVAGGTDTGGSAGNPHNNVQPVNVLNYFIKY